ncbi:hypothetical protein OG298_15905 [Streptomyces sp. NBC_01005]|uniref:hypothetical protein n=1 Tax=unclassified Streptomyces TaxID=2593676 RepID=UPI002E2FEB13|nr:hypothetical protein [Streptomyces sp. NBC_01362]WSW10576.1 hypothetical protein OG298_15905 [Streptomyces sp. NBC_01005]WTD00082.1 hypothetical protein OH736_15910 [Streptomyces sp. NBC_01650]
MPGIAVLVVVPLYVLWALVLATGGGDLAAQLAWAGFASRHPASAYNLSWYGGTHTANYSLLTPPLMAVFGVRAVTVAAGLCGSWALGRLCVRSGVRRPAAVAVLGSLTLWCNVASGRTTFALGVAIGLVALLYVRRRAGVAAGCAALATAASPVAGLFLVVAGAAYGPARQWRRAAGLVVPPVVVVAATTLVFPFTGEQPMAAGKLWMPLAACAALCLAAPREGGWRVVRFAGAVYAVGVVLTFLVASPIGTNVERLVGVAGPPVLLAALLTVLPRWARGGAPVRVRALLLAGMLVCNTGWLIDKTDDDLRVSTSVPAWAEHTDELVAELRRLGAGRTRVEVVPARNHREATVLAPYVNMARGWNRQLDVERGRLFYEGRPTPAAYRAWLDRWGVGLVVLHNGRPDGPAEAEARIVRRGADWLEPVWRDAGWRIYRVRGAVPLVSAPGSVVRGDDASLVVRMPAAGSVTVRIAHSPWLRANGGGCLRQDGEWTRLTVRRAGEYRLDSRYRLWPFGSC